MEIPRYAEQIRAQWDHQPEIRCCFGSCEWNDVRGGFALMLFLYAHEWVSSERPSVPIDLAIFWLIDKSVRIMNTEVIARRFRAEMTGFRREKGITIFHFRRTIMSALTASPVAR